MLERILLGANLLSSFLDAYYLRRSVLVILRENGPQQPSPLPVVGEMLNLLMIRLVLICVSIYLYHFGLPLDRPWSLHLQTAYTIVYLVIFAIELHRYVDVTTTCSPPVSARKCRALFVLDYGTLLATMLFTWERLEAFNDAIIINHRGLKPM